MARSNTHSNHGIVRHRAEELPADKERVRTVHKADPAKSVSREATRDPQFDDAGKSPEPRGLPEQGGHPRKH
jgi:hypothetical protein